MCDKSLVPLPCDSRTSCGISRPFDLLFPSHRQVTHALLTRPPLIRGRSPFSVRLECVMHAASVNPEPGSNSLKNGISTRTSVRLNISFRVCLARYFVRALFKISKEFYGVFLLCLVIQFSRNFRPRLLCVSPTILSPPSPFCQELFSLFFGFL